MFGYICILIYAVLVVAWVLLSLSGGKKYDDFIGPLDAKKYPLKSFFVIGFQFLDWIHFSYDSPSARTKRLQAKTVYGERYGEYFYRVNVAEKFTYLIMGILVSPLLGALLGGPIYMVFGVFAGGIGYYYAASKINDVVDLRNEEITRDFCDVVSKMALLINAGMITREAWEEISHTGEGTLYDEMKNSVLEMQNGVSEMEAYINFGNRCNVQLVKKFISMLVQNLEKGNKELVVFLKNESTVCWEEKQHLVKRQGEKAGSKMMIPLGLILVGIFIMILVPVVSNLGL